MHSVFSLKSHQLTLNSPLPLPRLPYHHHHQALFKITSCEKSSSSSDPKFRFRLLGRTLGDSKWKFSGIDTNAMQDSVNQWLSKTQNFLNEVTSPLVKTVNDRKPSVQKDIGDMEEIFLAEQTIDSRMPRGDLSTAAVLSIEQFSRMNGLTGKKMQKIFKALAPESVRNEARCLVEYCCFRFLSRDNSDVHPSLKEPAFRRLIFVTMLAWEQPYTNRMDSKVKTQERDSIKGSLVGEEAFVRIAPAVSGVADWSTAHNLFKALAGDEQGISYDIWSTYINELLKVHEGRKSYNFQESPQLYGEIILCLGSSRKPPVLKWENNIAWPGKLTLTEKALYFEKIGLLGQMDAGRLDLTGACSHIKKTRVGPLGSELFDSAISVTAGPEDLTRSDEWVLEFVDLRSDMRRDVWHASISEIISLHKFIGEFGPMESEHSISNVYGARKGKGRAVTYAINAIARLQALQFMKKLLDEPTKLVPFSYLKNAPYGDIVSQTLAVNIWGGPLITNSREEANQQFELLKSGQEALENSNHVFDIDGSVYLRKWMRSPSWSSSDSLAFWKNSLVRSGVVLSKNLVVADMTLVEKAAVRCREKSSIVEKTQATIDAAMIEGIPSNIDLFKELVLPLTIIGKFFEKLRHWEEPLVTASFLIVSYTIIFRNLLPYLLPSTLIVLASGMLLLKGLKEQGRLGRYFGKVTIHDQPPSNTIQKIIALKQAMREVEKYLQDLNISLLKIRTIILAGQPQVTTEVALILLLSATALLLVPFKYILACLLFDLFTRELEVRKQMVLTFMRLLKDRWDSVPASPVVVLPYELNDSDAPNQNKKTMKSESTQKEEQS